ncbi:MAG: hypothetical protein Q9205_005052 [Flavoplaca limonia]
MHSHERQGGQPAMSLLINSPPRPLEAFAVFECWVGFLTTFATSTAGENNPVLAASRKTQTASLNRSLDLADSRAIESPIPRIEVSEQASQLDLMEPVSLSIGAVGLVALLTTCVECFEYIDAAKSCGRDLELLTTKFAIEKARLLIWGESVGILSSTTTTTTSKVESSPVRPVIEQTLNCIRLRFEDTDALTARYGLKPAEVNASSLALTGPSGSIQSVALPLRLKTSYIRFKSRIDQNQKQTSTTKKTKWAIRDKQKFSGFVKDIHQFINGLEAITDSVEMTTKRAAFIREELSTVEDPQDLKLITEACADGNQPWSDAASVALGASVCGESNDQRIREWMSANSDVQMSTVVDYVESEPSWMPEDPIRDFPSHKHGDFGNPSNQNISNRLKLGPAQPAKETPPIIMRCTFPQCHGTFDNIYTHIEHQWKDHITEVTHWDCAPDNCPSRYGEAWTRFDDYRLHCQLKHADQDEKELLISALNAAFKTAYGSQDSLRDKMERMCTKFYNRIVEM